MKKYNRFGALALSAALALTMTACSEATTTDSAAASTAASPSQTPAQQGTSAESSTASQQTEVLGSLTSSELQELISGSTTLAQLTQERTEAAASSTESAASSPANVPEYEQQLQALIDQLYAVKAKAESGLNNTINSAKAEYKALPAAKQTQTRKIAIVMGKASELKAMEASCDKEVEDIVSQMRTILTQNGQSTALADEAMASYKAQKREMVSSLTNKLYS